MKRKYDPPTHARANLRPILLLALLPLFGGCFGRLQAEDPTLFASPLEDFIQQVSEARMMRRDGFNHSIKDMIFFEDRLYIGYGDATHNTGPIDIRSLDPKTGEMRIEASLEEHSIDRFRLLGDSLLIPSIDHLEFDLKANLYIKVPGADWSVLGVLPNALHVLDVIDYDGRLWACGSGYDSFQASKDKQDEAMVWVSDPTGRDWEIAFRWEDSKENHTARFNLLTANGKGIYALGIDRKGMTMTFNPMAVKGNLDRFDWIRLLPDFWPWETHALVNHEYLVTGVVEENISQGRFRTYRFDSAGKVWSLPLLDDAEVRLVDAVALPEGGALLLVQKGDLYDQVTFKMVTQPVANAVWKTDDFESAETWLEYESLDPFTSLAFKDGVIYLGTHEGNILTSPIEE